MKFLALRFVFLHVFLSGPKEKTVTEEKHELIVW